MILILTKENAKTTKYVRSIENPEWGIKKFNYNSQPLVGGMVASTIGTGINSKVVHEDEYKYWEVVK